MLTEDEAALEMLRAAYKPAQVHEQGKVPASPVTPYAVVSVSAGATGNYRLSGQHGSRGYRVAVQCFGKTKGELGRVVDAAEAAFLDRRIDLDGFDTSPCMTEVATPVVRDPDGGGSLYCLLTFTFNAYPTETP